MFYYNFPSLLPFRRFKHFLFGGKWQNDDFGHVLNRKWRNKSFFTAIYYGRLLEFSSISHHSNIRLCDFFNFLCLMPIEKYGDGILRLKIFIDETYKMYVFGSICVFEAINRQNLDHVIWRHEEKKFTKTYISRVWRATPIADGLEPNLAYLKISLTLPIIVQNFMPIGEGN